MSRHHTPEDGWTVIYDRVYEVSSFLQLHPGGEDVMLDYLGYDATIAFRWTHNSSS